MSNVKKSIKEIVLDVTLFLALLIVTILLGISILHTLNSKDHILGAGFNVTLFIPFYGAVIEFYYVARYFLIREENKYEILDRLNLMSSIVALLFICAWGDMFILNDLMGVTLLNYQIRAVMIIACPWSYIVFRVVYCIFNRRAITNRLKED